MWLNLSNNKFSNSAFEELLHYFEELDNVKVIIILDAEKIKHD